MEGVFSHVLAFLTFNKDKFSIAYPRKDQDELAVATTSVNEHSIAS